MGGKSLKTIVRGVERHKRNANWVLKPHQHFSVELTLAKTGEGFLFTPAGQSYPLNKGTLMLIPSNLPHGSVVVNQTEFVVLYLYSINLSPYCKFIYNTLLRKKKDSILAFHLLDAEVSEYIEQFARLETEFGLNTEEKEEAIRIHLEMLFLWLYRIYKKNNLMNTAVKETTNSIVAAGKEIEANYHTPIKIEELAARYYMSESYFRDKFKEYYSVSPKQYLMDVRLSEAKRALQRTDQSITSVSKEVGFASIHQFNQYFSKKESMTPSAWRSIYLSEQY
jgi:AraC family L-rhamnose operon transcriptional activator RhaR